ncbi:unnamed protein product [Trichogramma brassicae]|uniref:FERM N-terminal domain-containing protein n=1 Tax=Trichogramma brassicae TaxID=86971 RepID=A0A6H5IAD9_9HYME|nr:unnamed protein product [Trichogramma brassicae]
MISIWRTTTDYMMTIQFVSDQLFSARTTSSSVQLKLVASNHVFQGSADFALYLNMWSLDIERELLLLLLLAPRIATTIHRSPEYDGDFPQHKGKYILEHVCKQLNILETDYFGLRYVDSCRQRVSNLFLNTKLERHDYTRSTGRGIDFALRGEEAGNCSLLQQLHQQQPYPQILAYDVNYIDEESGLTHYHIACKAGFSNVRQFIEQRQDPNGLVLTGTNDSPLHLALDYVHFYNAAEILLRRSRSELSQCESRDVSARHLQASARGTEYLAQKLFQFCDGLRLQVQVNARDNMGNTPLQLAVNNLELNMVQYLGKCKGVDTSSLTFPSERHFDECVAFYASHKVESKWKYGADTVQFSGEILSAGSAAAQGGNHEISDLSAAQEGPAARPALLQSRRGCSSRRLYRSKRARRLRSRAARGQLHSREQAAAEADRVDRGEGAGAPSDAAQGLQSRAGGDALPEARRAARHLRRRSTSRQGNNNTYVYTMCVYNNNITYRERMRRCR